MLFSLYEGDTSPALIFTLFDQNNNPVDLRGAEVRMMLVDDAGKKVLDVLTTVVDEVSGKCRYNWSLSDTQNAGSYKVRFKVTYTDNTVETFPKSGSPVILIKKAPK